MEESDGTQCVWTGVINDIARGDFMLFIFCTLANKPVKSTIVEDTLFAWFCFGHRRQPYAPVETDMFVGKPTKRIYT
mgnify:CR=1 FL=1